MERTLLKTSLLGLQRPKIAIIKRLGKPIIIINGLDESDTGQVVLRKGQNGFLVSKQQSAGQN
jgi:hypothetical protein